MKGGDQPTVCDANIVLGLLPSDVQLGGDMVINKEAAEKAVQTIADGIGVDLMEAAEGIIKIVNESMFGALRLVSVEQGFDPRDFALVGFGGAGPLHANALGILSNSFPVIIPPGPGVLCAYGDATTQIQDEASRSYLAMAQDITTEKFINDLKDLKDKASQSLIKDGVSDANLEVTYQADVRYAGQAFQITVEFDEKEYEAKGIQLITDAFDDEHYQLFTFKLSDGHEILMIRAIVKVAQAEINSSMNASSEYSLEEAIIQDSRFYHESQWHDAKIYDRNKLHAKHLIPGPAIVSEMDSTTVILPKHEAAVDEVGNLIINPTN
jgi:N-methylhydantoinase A